MAELGADDFAALQTMLMQCKEEKYHAEEQRDAASRALEATKSEVEKLSKDLAKANKAIAKSKKARETKAMIDLHQAEKEELELQNKGLLENLAEISGQNEALQAEVDRLRKGTDGDHHHQHQQADGALQEQLTAALKQVEDLRADTDAKIADLQARNTMLSSQLAEAEAKYRELLESKLAVGSGDGGDGPQDKSADQDDSNTADDSSSDAIRVRVQQLEQVNAELKGMCQRQEDRAKQLAEENSELRVSSQQLQQQLDTANAAVDDARRQIDADKAAHAAELDELQQKYRRKQAALQELQQEKEDMYQQHTKEMEALKKKHESEVEALQLNADNETQSMKKMMQEKEEEAASKLAEVQSELEHLKESLSSHKDAAADLDARARELEETRAKLATAREEAAAAQAEAERLREEINADDSKQKIEQLNKDVEKWKEQVDEFSKQQQEQLAKHTREMDALKAEHEEKMKAVQKERDDALHANDRQAHKHQQEIARLQARVSASSKVEEEKQELSAQLKEAEAKAEALEDEKQSLNTQRSQLCDRGLRVLFLAVAAITRTKQRAAVSRVALEEKVAAAEKRADEAKSRIEQSEQSIAAKTKKEAAFIKELQKQLKREQRRAEKAERELAEIKRPGDRSASQMGSPSVSRRGHHRRTSSSSSSLIMREAPSLDSLNASDAHSVRSVDLQISESEHAQLLSDMVAVKTEREELNDKVRYLESKVRDLEGELCAKAMLVDQVIQTGSTNSSPSKGHKKTGDKAQLRESNDKLRVLLEETLLKNMQLEQMVEALTQQDKQ
ncbi:hypothetical protein PTSG_12180 [Salpingoeca rosetta]|uniref:GRIP domain-containing protein n=1 Tax=Salpingoeca rosetta (strain ATCC 50818 / BSB-021) TaxID=946362 RepID=F2U8N8_SALR5|nr:uncharacterized protein PTSG_12180 [Salpingoeca rosetta]EGD72746.1 hypothetical protein PTSG_12180 [Salpingoeca rosetta]|eukprot:XP_004994569.1 hypothetical protein PTSG_12180 [Salpingoeca rosetta]